MVLHSHGTVLHAHGTTFFMVLHVHGFAYSWYYVFMALRTHGSLLHVLVLLVVFQTCNYNSEDVFPYKHIICELGYVNNICFIHYPNYLINNLVQSLYSMRSRINTGECGNNLSCR